MMLSARLLLLLWCVAVGAEDVLPAAVNATNETVPDALYNLTDSDFDMRTRAMAGMTAGNWLVAFCCCEDRCPVSLLWTLAEALRSENSSDHLAVVAGDAHVGLSARFDVVAATKLSYFADSKMYPFAGDLSSESIRDFLNSTHTAGAKIPRRAGLLKPLHDKLSDFFDVVDYRALCFALGIAAVALVVIGAFMPRQDDDDQNDKDKETKDKKKDSGGEKKSVTFDDEKSVKTKKDD